MTVDALVVLAVSFLCALAVSWGIVLPFFQKQVQPGAGAAEREQQLMDAAARKERIVQALEDLEQDHISQKITDEDYRLSKAELTAEAVQAYSECDRLAGRDEGQLEEQARSGKATAS